MFSLFNFQVIVMTIAVSLLVPFLVLRLLFYAIKKINQKSLKTVAFFHPNCCDGGGGERVFWSFINTFLTKIKLDDDTSIIIYCGHTDKTSDDIFNMVENQFNIKFSSAQKARLHFCYISTRFLLNPKLFPFATMIFQVIAAVVISFDCLLRLTPDIFIDTCGIAYGYPFIKLLGGCSVVSYVHYPHISSDMMNLVREQRPSYNNDSAISKNTILTYLKLLYYILLGKLYSFVGLFADTVVVNSTWTEEHISELWSFPYNQNTKNQKFRIANTHWGLGIQSTRYLMKIYPPCNIQQLLDQSIIIIKPRIRAVLSVAQFRPEKGHMLQLLAFKGLLMKDPKKYADVKLYLLGSSRNEEDAKLVHSLREATKHLEISSYVEFVVNAPYSKLRELMQTVSIGIHSMWNEHFGISIVEMMASGMIMIAHNSGGPMKDIMVPLTGQTPHERIVGYVASSVVEYTDKLVELLNLSTMAAQNIRLAARQSVQERFGDDVVEKQVISLFNHILYPATYGLDIDSKSTDMILQANNSYRGNDGVNDDKQHTASSKRRSIKRKSLNKNKS